MKKISKAFYFMLRFLSRFPVRLFFFIAVFGSVVISSNASAAGVGASCTDNDLGLSGACQTLANCAANQTGVSGSCDTGLVCCLSGASSGGTATGAACRDAETPTRSGACIINGNCNGVPAQTNDCNGGLCCIPRAVIDAPATTGGTTTGAATGTGAMNAINGGCPAGTSLVGAVCIPSGTNLPTGVGFCGVAILGGPVVCVLVVFMRWLLAIFGFVAIIAFVIAGLQYILAFGDEHQIDTAKTHMKWSMIGVLVALAGYVIILSIDQLLRAAPTPFI